MALLFQKFVGKKFFCGFPIPGNDRILKDPIARAQAGPR